jgi:hypothetical protein
LPPSFSIFSAKHDRIKQLTMANNSTPPTTHPAHSRHWLLILLALLLAIMAVLFHKAFLPDWVVFNNDVPLGPKIREANELLPGLTGRWEDMNWVGVPYPGVAPTLTSLFLGLAGPILYAKFWAPASLVILGLCAWLFFRELKFTPLACVLGGLAMALNPDPFANACWGQVSRPLALSACFLALAAMQNRSGQAGWLKAVLAGICVGLGVVEGFDIGAIFSVVVAAWIVTHGLGQEGSWARRIGCGIGRVLLVAIFAGATAASTMTTLVGTQIKGVVGMSQDEQTRQMRWNEATQWSLPKREALGILAPGLFGFRMDTPAHLSERMQRTHAAGAYWGFVGRDAAWDRFLETDKRGPVPGGFLRYGGGSGYAGMLVLLVAAWAVVQSFRKTDSGYTTEQRRMIWFWLGVMGVAAALMFGRFAPFYQIIYALPYASTFRNPAKFMHAFEWALVVIFTYGLHSLTARYLSRAAASTRGVAEQFALWWRQAPSFEKKWVQGSVAALALAVLAWVVYAGLRGSVEAYVSELNQFATMQQGVKPDPVAAAEAARATISFSLGQVGWAVGFLAASVAAVALVISGGFAGNRARFAGVLLGLILVVDLAWQNQPWIIIENWRERYVQAGDNPAFDLLKTQPHQHRVSSMPDWLLRGFRLDPRIGEMEGLFRSVYGSEWMQHLFPYFNIQSLNIVQMPRRPVEYEAFEQSLQFDFTTNTLHRVTRRWQLTATDRIVGAAPLVSILNQAFDPELQRFQPILAFELYQERRGGPILTRTNANGPFAIIEFAGALPRAKLFTDWKVAPYDAARIQAWTDGIRQVFPPDYPLAFDSVATNDLATLELLTRASFDPLQTVLLAGPIELTPITNATPGSVEYVSYQRKHIVLKTKSAAPGVLLLNDKYDPNWTVAVSGQPAKLLRCNYLMRGVVVPAGEHTVEFQFRPPTTSLYVSLAMLLLGAALVFFLCLPTARSAKDSHQNSHN